MQLDLILNFCPNPDAILASCCHLAQVLVPGSGLARLACEISGRGYKSQGNDFDFFMLFTADFILNASKAESDRIRQSRGADALAEEEDVSEGCIPIYPWIHTLCNHMSHSDATRCLLVPDKTPNAILVGDGDQVKAEGRCLQRWRVGALMFFGDRALKR